MQFVAASKLRRAQESTLSSRPYSDLLDEILADLAAVLAGDEHPLLSRRDEGKRLIVLVTSDRGLAGALNTNAVRFASREIVEHPGELELVSVGRKGRDAMRRARVPIVAHFSGFGDRPKFEDTLPLARLISDEYEAGTYNQVDIVFTRFRLDSGPAAGHGPAAADQADQRHPRHPRCAVHLRAGSGPGPQPAAAPLRRHAALPDGAGKQRQLLLQSDGRDEERNRERDELIDDLTLSYNKARQANITRELIEIASGAKAR